MEKLIQHTERFVFNLFKDKLSSEYTYHNFLHTQYVVLKLNELLTEEKVDESDRMALTLAAWFHDVGYVIKEDGHEIEGQKIAENFLKENQVDAELIEKVKQLIAATHLNYEPQNHLERIIKDADFSHLGDSNFEKISFQLKCEIERKENIEISDAEWNRRNYEFLTQQHRFHTNYAKNYWQNVKMEHVIRTQEMIRNEKVIADKEKLRKSKVEKLKKPDRGIDTLFRVTLNNHTRLSDIADSKANILLSVNAIIISIALSTLLPKLASEKNHYLIMPTMIMLSVSVVCIIFAILATKPNISNTSFTASEVKIRKINLLFFGNFHKMQIDQYEEAMEELMSDRDYLYNALTRDLYFLGLVLARKYKLLSITYYLFMAGIIITVLAFVIAFTSKAEFNAIDLI